jgi:hypothetical protein
MKKLLLVLALTTLTGCAALSTMKACYDDPVCLQERVDAANKVKGQVTAVAGVVSPVPWAGPVAGGIAGIGTLLVGLYLGGKKKQGQ